MECLDGEEVGVVDDGDDGAAFAGTATWLECRAK
jgi:hypothetical protein